MWEPTTPVSLAIGSRSAYLFPVVGKTIEGKNIIQYTPTETRIQWDSGHLDFLVTTMPYHKALDWLQEHNWRSDGDLFNGATGKVFRFWG